MDRNENITGTSSESGASDSLLLQTLQKWYHKDIGPVLEWRKQALEDYAFYNGEQWAEEDIALLRQQKRPVMTFNRIAPLVNAIIGAEINNRRQVRYIPRQLGDSIADEILTGAGEWFRDQAEAQDEESTAFADTVIAGMGWIDTRLDFESNPDGAPVVQRLDPFKMVWDSAATKANLIDAKRLWYVEEKPIEELQSLFPDVPVSDLHAYWAHSYENIEPKGPYQGQSAYEGEGAQRAQDDRAMATLVECRWYEKELYFRAPDLATGEMRAFSPEEMQELLQRFPEYPHIRQYRKVVKRAFIGRTLLAPPDKPLVPEGHLGWECITGYYDKIAQLFYGVVRPTKDPQRWANKFFSQIMYVLNSQAKGGILAERGAFDNDLQAEESLARADQITWTKSGALSGVNARIQPKPNAQFPSGFFTLFNETKNALTQVTGLSPEFVGTREINQPGVLETQRRQSSLNLLASLFNALKRYRKRQGWIMLYLLKHYLCDGRLIRIIGQENERYIRLTQEVFHNMDYDVIVDDAPTTPNEKERNFALIQQVLPLFKDYLTPEIGMEILKYSPLPTSLIEKWKMTLMKDRQTPVDQAPGEPS